MQKIIYILFLFLICFLCYFIYHITNHNELNITLIGDNIANYKYLNDNLRSINYNTDYINKDYRLIDIVNIIKYNQELDGNISIHQS